MRLPERLHVSEAKPFLNRGVIRVYLDGAEIDKVISFDIPAREVVRFATDAAGRLIPYGENAKIEKLTGDVEATFTLNG